MLSGNRGLTTSSVIDDARSDAGRSRASTPDPLDGSGPVGAPDPLLEQFFWKVTQKWPLARPNGGLLTHGDLPGSWVHLYRLAAKNFWGLVCKHIMEEDLSMSSSIYFTSEAKYQRNNYYLFWKYNPKTIGLWMRHHPLNLDEFFKLRFSFLQHDFFSAAISTCQIQQHQFSTCLFSFIQHAFFYP